MDDIKITEYKKTEHYTLTKQFLDNPEKMLKYLLEE
jgi:predicted ATPase